MPRITAQSTVKYNYYHCNIITVLHKQNLIRLHISTLRGSVKGFKLDLLGNLSPAQPAY